MGEGRQEYRKRPCAGCPWRTDVDLAGFSDADFAKLRRANGTPGAEAAREAPAMSCHQDQPGTSHAMRLCAGWLAVVGRDHLAVRMAVLAGRLPESAVVAGQDWPTLYDSLDAMIAHRPTAPPGQRSAVADGEIAQESRDRLDLNAELVDHDDWRVHQPAGHDGTDSRDVGACLHQQDANLPHQSHLITASSTEIDEGRLMQTTPPGDPPRPARSR